MWTHTVCPARATDSLWSFAHINQYWIAPLQPRSSPSQNSWKLLAWGWKGALRHKCRAPLAFLAPVPTRDVAHDALVSPAPRQSGSIWQ